MVAVTLAAASVIAGSGEVQAADAATEIDVCCAWNLKLSDGELTYKISGASGATLALMEAAVEDWDTATDITLTPVTGREKADIEIKFKKGGGAIQGQALRKFDAGGFINSVTINVSGMAFGGPSEVHQITMHEVGHALGAGHANGDGVLMSPTVSGGVDAITACDVDAVRAAQKWWVDHALVPAAPSATSVAC
jgi:hypothetical protein